MGLFDEAAARAAAEEIAGVYTTRDLLADCAALRTVLEAADPTASKLLIIIGTTEPPWNGEAYEIGELESRIAFCQLYPKLSEGSLLVVRDTGGTTPKKEGYFRLHVRRQVRRSEYEAPDGRNDVWRYFWYLTSLMCEQFVLLTDENTNNPGLVERQIRRDGGPAYNIPHQDNWPEFGYFLFANFLMTWAGIEGGE